MRKVLAGLLFFLAGPQVASAQGYNGLYCGHPGFNLNLTVTTKSFQCRPSPLVVGQGTLTFVAADNTVTCSGGSCFAGVAAIDALPGADGAFFNRSGLIAWVGDVAYWYRIDTRTSATSLEVANGTTAPAANATTRTWSYWNTTCYRSFWAYTGPTGDANFADQRIWAPLGSRTVSLTYASHPVSFVTLVGQNSAAISGTGAVDWARPSWMKQFGSSGTQITFGSNTAGLVKMGSSWNTPLGLTLASTGTEYSLSVQSTNGDGYGFVCSVRGE